jgi:hypothetical protein
MKAIAPTTVLERLLPALPIYLLGVNSNFRRVQAVHHTGLDLISFGLFSNLNVSALLSRSAFRISG